VFVDIDPRTYTMDPAAAAAAVTAKTRALLPVHLYGQCADMNPLLRLARAHDLFVVEDAAQAHGATYRGRRAGTMGHAGCFSFYPTKNLGAYGDGGAVVTGDADVADRLRRLRNYGQTRKYVHESVGYNSRLDEVQAAILRAKLPHLDDWNRRRRAIAEQYRAGIAGRVAPPAGGRDRDHVYHLFVVQSPDRDGLQRHLAARGVGAQVHYPVPVHRQPVYRTMPARHGDLPVTEAAAGRVLSLPMYPALSAGRVDRVIRAVNGYAG